MELVELRHGRKVVERLVDGRDCEDDDCSGKLALLARVVRFIGSETALGCGNVETMLEEVVRDS